MSEETEISTDQHLVQKGPESADNTFDKEEFLSDCDDTESTSGKTGSPFCVLCLRECTTDVLIQFSSLPKRNCINVAVGLRKLKQALALTVSPLDSFGVCRTCWKLVQLMGDFRKSCLKSASWIERFARGMPYEAEIDNWLSQDTFKSVDELHQGIQDNHNRIELEEIIASSTQKVNVVKKTHKKVPKKKVQRKVHKDVADDMDAPLDASRSLDTNSENERLNTTGIPLEVVVTTLENDNHNPSIVSCEKCGRKFDGEWALKMHMHAENCLNDKKVNYRSCTICNATFKDQSGLKFHMNKHNGIKPYKCRKFCDRTFYSNFVRIKHERHICELDGRICSICGAQLKNEFQLKKHLESVHGEAKHVCATCGKAFRAKVALRDHQRVHSDERKYPCTVCGKSYKSPYAAKTHMRTHTQEKPFSCHVCGQAFTYKVTMKAHIERHHGQTG